MFLGYQKEKIVFISETLEKLKSIPCVSFDKIEETQESVELVDNTYFVGNEAIKEAKSTFKRKVRDNYLVEYVDSVVSNPLRWAEMSVEEQNIYKDYRRYLLDVTESSDFPDIEIMTLDEWKEQQVIEENSRDSEIMVEDEIEPNTIEDKNEEDISNNG